MPSSFEWVHYIPGLNALPSHLAHTLIIMLVLMPLVWAASAKLRRADYDIVPEKRFGVMPLFEMAYEAIHGLAKDILGHHADRFIYLIGGLAFFIFFSNIMGTIPGFAPPTDNINTTAACALSVFFATHIYGFKAHGISYLKHFVGPSPWLAPLMIPIEIIGHLARPLSLSLRLFGNMFGDHLVLAIFVFMITGLTKALLSSFLFFLAPVSLVIPVLIMVLGIFVAVVQTLVFILLTMSYLAGAVADHH